VEELMEDVSNVLMWYARRMSLETPPFTQSSCLMIPQVLPCPHCHGTDIVRHGNTRQGTQRYRCRECREGRGRTLLLDDAYSGQSPAVKERIVEMAMHAGGIRDTARVLHISSTTGINERNKRPLRSTRWRGNAVGRMRWRCAVG
jgi:transposase-like protein